MITKKDLFEGLVFKNSNRIFKIHKLEKKTCHLKYLNDIDTNSAYSIDSLLTCLNNKTSEIILVNPLIDFCL